MGECRKDFSRKDPDELEDTLYVFCLTLCASWAFRKDDGKDYSFDYFYGLLIREQNKLFDEGKHEVKQQSHFLKGKYRHNYRERGWKYNKDKERYCIDEDVKKNHGDQTSTKKSRMKKTYCYWEQLGHIEKDW